MNDDPHHHLPAPVWQALSRWGLILEQDKTLPSVAGIISGGPLSGSWWGNPSAKGTYEALQALEDLPDVLCIKLVSGKVTFALDRLWPAVLAVGQAREPWQLKDLTNEASSLLDLVDAVGSIRLDEVPGPSKSFREAARNLERRLLVYGRQVHTSSGAHAKALESWAFWSGQTRPELRPLTLPAAKAALEEAVADLNSHFNANAWLPWQTRTHRSQS